ncbi:DUF805 domain-containing protein [Enterobacteriaceae bacterium BIT-l23]|uniref:DUF805 domain-containing protein n=1 Tax=Jejubacter sp. L23 TaxID=3092086 RepID=UPI001585461F|nr:DUF805 domain-containing protein [Enterobacteriaceae bacterium BIT-l23]
MFFIKNGVEGYRKAFSYKGVADRKSYLFFVLFQWIVIILVTLASFYLKVIFQGYSGVGLFIVISISLYSWLAGLAFSVRRLHDTGQSGWILLILFIIVLIVEAVGEGGGNAVNAIFFLGLMLAKTKSENNKYRPDNFNLTKVPGKAPQGTYRTLK